MLCTCRVNAIHLGPCVTWNEDFLQSQTQGMPDWIEKGDKVGRLWHKSDDCEMMMTIAVLIKLMIMYAFAYRLDDRFIPSVAWSG